MRITLFILVLLFLAAILSILPASSQLPQSDSSPDMYICKEYTTTTPDVTKTCQYQKPLCVKKGKDYVVTDYLRDYYYIITNYIRSCKCPINHKWEESIYKTEKGTDLLTREYQNMYTTKTPCPAPYTNPCPT